MRDRNLLKTGGLFLTAVFAVSLISAETLYAADVPNNFTNGTTASADEVNANFKFLSDRSWDKSTSRVNPDGAACPGAPDTGCDCPGSTVWKDDNGDGLIDTGECEQSSLVAGSVNIGVGTISLGGRVGIGTSTPQATLDINGFMKLQRNCRAPAACDSTIRGAVALTANSTMCACNGSTWVNVANGTASCIWFNSSCLGRQLVTFPSSTAILQ